MKSKILRIVLLACVPFIMINAIGCGGDDNGGATEDLVVNKITTGADPEDLPNYDVVDSNMVNITCSDTDDTKDAALVVSCLNEDGDITGYVNLECFGGDIYYEDSNDNAHTITGTCANVYCLDEGAFYKVSACQTNDDDNADLLYSVDELEDDEFSDVGEL